MIKVVIVGAGRIGTRHAEHVKNTANLVAVCDVDLDKSKFLGEKYGVPYFTSLDDCLGAMIEADVFSICTPNGLHAEHSIAALNAGYHVLCEKPLGISAAQCGMMINAAEKANRRLFTIKQNRFNPPVAAVKQAIEKGAFGRVLSVQLSCFWNRNLDYYENSWKGTMKLDGGTLYTQFSHFVDLLYWLIGDVESISGFSDNLAHHGIIEFEDTGVVAVRFVNGALGTINYNVNSYEKNMEGSLTIFGEKGTVKIGGQYLNELEYQSFEDYKIEGLITGNAANNYGNYQGSMSNHDKIYENLVNVLTTEGIISTSSYEGMKSVEIIERIYREIR